MVTLKTYTSMLFIIFLWYANTAYANTAQLQQYREIILDKNSLSTDKIIAVRRLGESQDPASILFLESYLLSYSKNLNHDAGVRNHIMKVFRQSLDDRNKVKELLVHVYKDQNREMLMQDFALQHLGEMLIEAPDPDIEQLLINAFNELKGYSSTALNLLRLSSNNVMAKDEISASALEVLMNDQLPEDLRLSALSWITHSNSMHEETLAYIRKISATERAPQSLRLMSNKFLKSNNL